MAFYPSVPEGDTKVERLLTLCSYYDKIYSEADKLYFEAERMDKLRMNAAINTIRGYDDKIYQLTGESLVGNQLSLLSYSYETESFLKVFDIIIKILGIVATALFSIRVLRSFTRPKDTLSALKHRPVKDASDKDSHNEHNKKYTVTSPLCHDFHEYSKNAIDYAQTMARVVNIFHSVATEYVERSNKDFSDIMVKIKHLEERAAHPGDKNNSTPKGTIDASDTTGEHENGKADREYKDTFSRLMGFGDSNAIYCTDMIHGSTGVVILDPSHPKVPEIAHRVVVNIDRVEHAVKELSSNEISVNAVLRQVIIPVQFVHAQKNDIIMPSYLFKTIDDELKSVSNQLDDAIKKFESLSKTAEEHNKILISSVERLSKIEMPPNELWMVRDILADVRAAASRTTGIVSDFHTIVKGMRIKPYY